MNPKIRRPVEILLVEDSPKGGFVMPMSAVYPSGAPPGPAGRWLIERLKQCPQAEAGRSADGMRAVPVRGTAAL